MAKTITSGLQKELDVSVGPLYVSAKLNMVNAVSGDKVGCVQPHRLPRAR